VTSEVSLRPFDEGDAESLLGLRLKNRAFLIPFEPQRPTNIYTLSAQRQQIASDQDGFSTGWRFAFGIYLDEALVGRVSLDNIVRGAWQNATLGYFVDHEHNSKGIATEAVRRAVAYGFEEASLHRMQAGVMPRNARSIRVLEKVGFRFEGVSLRYLQINGVWEDHNMYALTLEDWTATSTI
jgi:[ribosomal protein S5]-alanine N-acetyltransferase